MIPCSCELSFHLGYSLLKKSCPATMGVTDLELRRSILRTHGVRELDDGLCIHSRSTHHRASSITPLEEAIAKAFGVALEGMPGAEDTGHVIAGAAIAALRNRADAEAPLESGTLSGRGNDPSSVKAPCELADAESEHVSLQQVMQSCGVSRYELEALLMRMQRDNVGALEVPGLLRAVSSPTMRPPLECAVLRAFGAAIHQAGTVEDRRSDPPATPPRISSIPRLPSVPAISSESNYLSSVPTQRKRLPRRFSCESSPPLPRLLQWDKGPAGRPGEDGEPHGSSPAGRRQRLPSVDDLSAAREQASAARRKSLPELRLPQLRLPEPRLRRRGSGDGTSLRLGRRGSGDSTALRLGRRGSGDSSTLRLGRRGSGDSTALRLGRRASGDSTALRLGRRASETMVLGRWCRDRLSISPLRSQSQHNNTSPPHPFIPQLRVHRNPEGAEPSAATGKFSLSQPILGVPVEGAIPFDSPPQVGMRAVTRDELERLGRAMEAAQMEYITMPHFLHGLVETHDFSLRPMEMAVFRAFLGDDF